MKKFWTVIMLSLLLLCTGVILGCDEDRTLSSISISINQEYATASENASAVPTYNIQLTNRKIPLSITLTPTSFNVQDLSFYSSAENVCYITSDGYLVTRSGGSASLRAYYKNSNGGTISFSFKVNVLTTPVPKFNQTSYTLNYNGANQIDNANLKVVNENDESYVYAYYYHGNNGMELTDKIKNAGNYTIKYQKKDDVNFVVAQMSVVVNKANLMVTAQNLQSTYYEDIESMSGEDKFYYSDTTSFDKDLTSNVGEDAGKRIGQYSYVTSASKLSFAGRYDVSVKYQLDDEYKNNYNITIVKGTHTIGKLSLILVINDATATYGDELVKNNFSLYPAELWSEPFNPSPSSAIDDEMQAYLLTRGDVSMKEYSLENGDGVTLSKNNYGNYDVITSGKINITTSNLVLSSNVEITHIQKGSITIDPKSLTVDILGTASKRHLERDDISTLTLSFGEDAKFARELLASDIINIDYPEDYGNGGYSAPAGSYSYKLNENLSSNFEISLADRCKSDYSGLDKAEYVINKAEVIVQFDLKQDIYKNASGITVSYYDENATYNLSLKSLSINGRSYVSTSVDSDGLFSVLFSNGEDSREKIGFEIGLNKDSTTPANVYERYILEAKLKFGSSTYSESYHLSSSPSYLSLTKQKAYYYLKNSGEAVYSGYGSSPDTSTFFGADNVAVEDENGKNIGLGIGEILSNTDNLFTFEFAGKYYFTADGIERQSSQPGNAGEYEVFARSLTDSDYKDEYKYLDLEFKASSCAKFTISKMSVTITPKDNNGKIYGSADGEINFDCTDLPEQLVDLVGSTGLSRESGENVGSYRINKGNLAFVTSLPEGEFRNYELTFSEEEVFFTITPRTLLIKPNDTTITYGQKYPLRDTITSSDYQMSIKDDDGRDVSVKSASFATEFPCLVLPSQADFIGKFKLSKDGVAPAENVGDIYDVLYDGGLVKEYTIILDSESVDGFKYTGTNYNVVIDTTSAKCRINPKEATLTFVPTGRSNAEGLTEEAGHYVLEFNSIDNAGTYSITGLLSNITKTSLVVRATMNADNSLLYADSLSDIDFKVEDEGGGDFTLNYSFKLLGKKIYNIASELITIQLQHEGSNTCTSTYNASEQDSLFTLAITSSDKFEIDEINSLYNIVYRNSEGEIVQPQNAGNYTVSVELPSGENSGHLVLKKKETGELIVFESFDTRTNGYILNFAGSSSLSIDKADVTFDADEIEFEKDFVYNSAKAELPLLKLSGDSGAYYKGVNDEALALAYTDGLNYELVGQLLSLLTTGTYSATKNVSLHLQVAKFYDGDTLVSFEALKSKTPEQIVGLTQVIDNNYNPIEISDKQIEIKERAVIISGYSVSIKDEVLSNNKYSCAFTGSQLEPQIAITGEDSSSIESSVYRGSLSRYQLDFSYNEDKIQLEYYDYIGGEITGSKKTISADSVNLTSKEDIKQIGSNNYLIVGEKAFQIMEQTIAYPLRYSGAWVISYEVFANNGYIFVSDEDSDEEYRTFKACYLVYINKDKEYLEDVFRSRNNVSFYEGTNIDTSSKEDIRDNKFGISVPTRFVDMLTFNISPEPSDTPIPIGSYKLVCSIEGEPNYYLKKEIDFNIIKCRAEVGLSYTTSYIYTGNEIYNFMNELSVTFYDYLGEVSYVKSYSQLDQSKISMEYVDLDTTGWATGQKFAINKTPYGEYYRISFTYEDDRYKTEESAIYEYRIEPRPYNGNIERFPTYIDYDPNLEYSTLYQKWLSNIRVVDKPASEIESITIFYGENISTQEDEEDRLCLTLPDGLDEDELSQLSYDLLSTIMQVGIAPITYKITFTDETISSEYRSTYFNVRAKSVTDSTFSFVSASNAVYYTGHPQYQAIKFSNVDLSPGIEQAPNGYTLETDMTEMSSGVYKVTLKDRFQHKVLRVIYTYTQNGSPIQSPIMPGSYKVSYSIEAGSDYIINKQFEDREYTVRKAEKINFFVTVNDENLIYTASNILSGTSGYIQFNYDKFISGQNFITIVAQNNDNKDVKFHANLITSTYSSTTYSSSVGVSLFIGFKSAESPDGPFITNITNCGEYIAYIYVDRNSAYHPEDHFNKIEFNNSNVILNSDTLQTSDGYVYSVRFTLKEKDIGLNENNVEEFVDIITTNGASYGMHDYQIDDYTTRRAYYVESGVNFQIKDSTKYDLFVYYSSGGISGNIVSDYDTKGFTNVSVTACYMPFIIHVVPKDENCYSSYEIMVIVHFDSDSFVRDYIVSGNTLTKYDNYYGEYILDINSTTSVTAKSNYSLKAYYFTNGYLGEEVADFASKGFKELDEQGDVLFKVALVSTIDGVDSVNYLLAVVHFPEE